MTVTLENIFDQKIMIFFGKMIFFGYEINQPDRPILIKKMLRKVVYNLFEPESII